MSDRQAQLEQKKKEQKIEAILNHKVEGEGFIVTSSREWKRIVLRHFNRVQRKEISVEQLLAILKNKNVISTQSDQLTLYPIKACLKYIAKVSNQEIDV